MTNAPEEKSKGTKGISRTDASFPGELSVVVGTDPSPLVASPRNQEPNRAALRVLVTNVNNDSSAKAYKIMIQLKVADDNNPSAELLSESWSKRGKDITRQPDTRTPSSDNTGGYAFTYSGGEDENPFKPGESVALFIDGIPVSAQEGATAVAVGVQADQNDEPAWKIVPLGKFPTGYYLKELRADDNPVDYKEQAILTWLAPPIEGIEYKLYANGSELPLDKNHPQPVHTPPLTTDTTFELVPSWATDVRHKQRLLVRVLNGDLTTHNVTVNGNLDVTGKTNAQGDLTVRYGGSTKLNTSGVSDVEFPRGLTSRKRLDANEGILVKNGDDVKITTTEGTDVKFPQGLRADRQIYSTGDLAANGRVLIGYSANYDGMSPGDIWVMNKATIGYNASLDLRGNLVSNVSTYDKPTSFNAGCAGILIGWIQVSHDTGKAASAELKATVKPPGMSSFDITAWVDDDGNAGSFSVPLNRGTGVTFSVWKSSNLDSSCVHKAFWLPFA
ncbi:hypothetical protein [Nocardiopsis quinghaiensis]|uniref:hypothetical protein n=1 Tax=Nocardiopsis quinghaiensis TaxID=464995 RepID=UPI0012390A5A|nr:hypothetical protein [Nocardiopsis quinghaiensis]